MNMLSLLTIVVPTYERQPYALRQIRYWSKHPVSLYILDGTEDPLPEHRIKKLPENIHYLHLPYSYQERLKRCVDLINTPYVLMQADDEFFIPSALEACISELESDSSIVSCMGQAIQFWYGPQKKILGKTIYDMLAGYKVNQKTPSERMIYHMNPYICSTIYSILRAPVWKKNISLIAQKNYSSPVASELQFELGTCCQGKSRVIDSLMWLRSGENPPTTVQGWDRRIDFKKWYSEKTYAAERADFIDGFVGHFSDEYGVKYSDIDDALKAHNLYLDTRKNSGIRRNIYLWILDTTKSILKRISPWLLTKSRRLVGKIRYYMYRNPELEQIAIMLASKNDITIDCMEIARIVNLVGDFREKNAKL